MYKINVDIQKINGGRLKTYKMIIVLFQIDNKDGKFCFFEKTFILAYISIDVAFGLFFLILSNIKVNFNN